MMLAATIVLACVVAGSWVFCILTVVACQRYLAVRPPELRLAEPLSVLKPLHGLDEGLEENLRSFFTQDYPSFELLFAAREASDPALAVVERLKREFPQVPARSFVTGEPAYPNAKVWSLQIMTEAAANDLLILSDSDIRIAPGALREVAREFQDPKLGVATCPYRAAPGSSPWSTLEAIGMNTEFWGGAITARMVEGGVRFAVGPTVAARRSVIEAIGGWLRLSEYLAEDFVLGQFASQQGYGVILSCCVVEHRIGSQEFGPNLAHRMRWNRSTRRSRPAGYVGQLFTYPIPAAALLFLLAPTSWPALVLTLMLRGAAAAAVAFRVLKDPLCRRLWYLIPVQDAVSAALWIAGFFGNTIVWRGRRYRVLREGRFQLIPHLSDD
jgi:ceramide glucosyltransferase